MANNFNPYNTYSGYNSNFYMQDLQAMRDRIDRTMQQYQQNQNMQSQQPIPQVTQHFQLAPQVNQNPNDLQSAYVNNIDEVKNIFMTRNGIFVNKELNSAWFKDTEGKIRTFSLIEIVEKDEKDLEIDNLKKQLNDIKSLMTQQAAMLQQQQNVTQSVTNVPEMKIEPEKKVVEKKTK